MMKSTSYLREGESDEFYAERKINISFIDIAQPMGMRVFFHFDNIFHSIFFFFEILLK